MDLDMDILQQSESWFIQNQDLLIQYGVNLISATITLLIGYFIAKGVSGTLRKLMNKQEIDTTITDFISSIVRYAILTFVVIAALSRVGVQTASFVAIIGAAGLAVGLALQGSLSNFASGVLIIIFRPFKAGEYVELAGTAGTVESVQIFSTVLTTPDNKVVVVANSTAMNSNIVNYSRKPTRRIDLVVGVSYDADLALTRDVLRRVIDEESRILTDQETTIAVSELADSSVNFVVRPWVKTSDYWPVRFDLQERFKNALDEAGIEIPFPQVSIHHNSTQNADVVPIRSA